MKKVFGYFKLLIGISISLATIFLLIFSIISKNNTNSVIEEENDSYTDAQKFKIEYEKLNNNKEYIEVNINDNNPIKYISFDDIDEIIINNGIIFIGSANENLSRNSIPILLQVAQNYELDTVYYLNEISSDQFSLLKNKLSIDFDDLQTPMFIFASEDSLSIHIEKAEYYENLKNGMTSNELNNLYNIFKDKLLLFHNNMCPINGC